MAVLFTLPQDATVENAEGVKLELICVNREAKRVSLGAEDERADPLADGWEYIDPYAK